MRVPVLSRSASFWLLGALLFALLFAAGAPSPLYVVYEERWGFSAIVLTAVFAVYALALLVALLITGRLSDYLGRRPVLAAGLVVQVAAMVAFLLAEGVAMLFVARTLQGVATGIATAALSAWLLDLEPRERTGLGSVVASVAPLIGLALGALASGFLVQYGPDPLRLVFWLLLAAYLLVLLVLPAIEDVAERRPGWRASLRPEVGVPPAARPLFAAMAPSLVATWALGGLYLSLGPSLAISLLGSESHVAGGLVIVALTGTGALVSALAHSVEPQLLVARASLALLAGTAITLVAVATGSTVAPLLRQCRRRRRLRSHLRRRLPQPRPARPAAGPQRLGRCDLHRLLPRLQHPRGGRGRRPHPLRPRRYDLRLRRGADRASGLHCLGGWSQRLAPERVAATGTRPRTIFRAPTSTGR